MTTTQPNKTMTSLCSALDSYNSSLTSRVMGEKGTNLHSLSGMTTKESTPDVQGALVALNTHLVRGNTSTSQLNFDRDFRMSKIALVNNVISSTYTLSAEDKAKYLRDLVVLCFQKRDIRGQLGGGERTLSYWMLLRLHEKFPKTIEVLLQDLPNIGSWLDFKKLYEISSLDIMTPDKTNPNWRQVRQSRINFNQRIVDIWVTQCQLDEITLDSGDDGDNEDRTLSLLFKWIVKPKSSLDRRFKVCSQIARKMYPALYEVDSRAAMKKYRQLVSRGNAAINTTERLMASKQFSKIDFRLVPGRCLNKFHKAWKDEDKKGNRRHNGDADREACIRNYMAFLELVKKGKVSAKGKSMFIHEIVREVRRYGGADSLRENDPSRYTLLEAQFKDHVESFREFTDVSGLDDSVFLADVSGSMDGDPLDVAIGVTVVGSSITTGPFRNKAITFESVPRWITMEYPTSSSEWMGGYNGYSSRQFPVGRTWDPNRVGKELDYLEKITVVTNAGWDGSTNFLGAINMIYQCTQIADCPMPKRVICITDMQWDHADQTHSFNSSVMTKMGRRLKRIPDMGGSFLTSIEHLKRYFESENMVLPEFIVWNARGNQRSNGCAAAADTEGVQMISGFSVAMLKLFLTEGSFGSVDNSSGSANSWDTLRMLLDHEDYDRIRHVVAMVGENEFSVLRSSKVEVVHTEEAKVASVPTAPSTTSSGLPFDVDSLSPEQLKALLGQVLKKL